MRELLRDVLYAMRRLVLSPGFTVPCLVCLTLALGACIAAFSLVNAVVLKPLPGPYPERIMQAHYVHLQRGLPNMGIMLPEFEEWKHQSTCFDAMALMIDTEFTLTGAGDPVQIHATAASASYFDVFKVPAARGRTFGAGEDDLTSPKLAVLGDKLWRNRFGADPAVIGRAIQLDAETYTVIGVMPASFHLPEDETELWTQLIPVDIPGGNREYRKQQIFHPIVRLKAGITAQQAQVQLGDILKRINQGPYRQDPLWQGLSARVRPLNADTVANSAPLLAVLLGSGACVLLIACANVANLLLGRNALRLREFAVRAALGATRGQLMREVMIESLLLSLTASLAATILGIWAIRGALAFSPWKIADAAEVGVDWRVLLFVVGLSLATALLFGLLPAFRVAKADLVTALKAGERGMTTARGQRLRHALVAAEVGLTLLLLVGMGLLLRSFVALNRVDLGFRPDGVLVVDLRLSETRYKDSASIARLGAQLIERLKDRPDVNAVAFSVSQGLGNSVLVGGEEIPTNTDKMRVISEYQVLGDYVPAMGARLVSGRWFTSSERAGATPVMVVNRRFVQENLPSQEPVGAIMHIGEVQYQVVGVVDDLLLGGPLGKNRPAAYVPFDQEKYPMPYVRIIARTIGTMRPTALIPACREALRAVDPELAIDRADPLTVAMMDRLAPQRFGLALVGGFAVCALVLALAGLYGVTSYQVSQRTREVGIRMALGADPMRIVVLVLTRSLVAAAVGIAIGLGGVFAVTRWLQSLLYGVTPFDAVTIGCVVGMLLVTAAVAAFLPAWRAAHANPAESLRYE